MTVVDARRLTALGAGLAEFLAQLAQQAHEATMKALMTEDTNDTDEEE